MMGAITNLAMHLRALMTSFSSIAYFRQFSESPAKVILIQGPAAMLTVAPGREACPESSAT
jgi:hypothetical protein